VTVWLYSPAGKSYKPELHNAILEAYDRDKDKVWEMAFREKKVPLIVSFYKETLRF
jgi:phenylacetate 2-hydroxylase